jgi:hypothetical protein
VVVGLHEHPDVVDGVYYMSRLHTGMFNLAIFDRAIGKLSSSNQLPVSTHPQWPTLATQMNIAVIETFEGEDD